MLRFWSFCCTGRRREFTSSAVLLGDVSATRAKNSLSREERAMDPESTMSGREA